MNTLTDNHDELRARMSADVHRPQFHFSAPAGWMNDPNGLIQVGGMYHLFYQHNPHSARWGIMHWGHATSRDLVHWQDQPVALHPIPNGPDKDGCFSGSAIVEGASLKLFYTGVEPQCQCVADSDETHTVFRRRPGPALIPVPPAGYRQRDFRDPYVFKRNDEWCMVVGSGDLEDRAALLLYKSTDLEDWQFVGPMLAATDAMPEPFRSSCTFECPSLFPLGDRWVLILSCLVEQYRRAPQVPILIGQFDGERFDVERYEVLDGGTTFYAPQAFIDESGRAIMMAWLTDTRPQSASDDAGWNGLLTVPRVIDFDAQSRLTYNPVHALQELRSAAITLLPRPLPCDEYVPLDEVRSAPCEIELTLEPNNSDIELAILFDPDTQEQVLVTYSAQTGQLTVDTTGSSRVPGTKFERCAVPLRLDRDEHLHLRVLVDVSIIEVIGNGRACAAVRVFPTSPRSVQARLKSHGGRAAIVAGCVYALRSIWNR